MTYKRPLPGTIRDLKFTLDADRETSIRRAQMIFHRLLRRAIGEVNPIGGTLPPYCAEVLFARMREDAVALVVFVEDLPAEISQLLEGSGHIFDFCEPRVMAEIELYHSLAAELFASIGQPYVRKTL